MSMPDTDLGELQAHLQNKFGFAATSAIIYLHGFEPDAAAPRWYRYTLAVPRVSAALISCLLVQLVREGAVLPLVVPSLRPRAGAEGSVGEVELVISCQPQSSPTPQPFHCTLSFRTWRQGLKSSPLARMHLW